MFFALVFLRNDVDRVSVVSVAHFAGTFRCLPFSLLPGYSEAARLVWELGNVGQCS